MRDADIVYDDDGPDDGDDEEAWFNAVRHFPPATGFPKQHALTVRVDDEIVDGFKAHGPALTSFLRRKLHGAIQPRSCHPERVPRWPTAIADLRSEPRGRRRRRGEL
jgi:hypothetical protein